MWLESCWRRVAGELLQQTQNGLCVFRRFQPAICEIATIHLADHAFAEQTLCGRNASRIRFVMDLDAVLHGVEVKQWPSRLGVRESRRACGVYQLTREDVLSERRFADGVARAVWPMEFREDARGPRLVYAAGMDGTDIPLRCLRHANMSNLWLAGRCISADHDAAASIRVMGTCLASGQAAGAAAALLRDETPCPDWNDLAQRVRDVIGSMVRLPAEPGNWELAG
jgi:hypothetical protein